MGPAPIASLLTALLTGLLLWTGALAPVRAQPGDTYTRGADRPWTVSDSALVRMWLTIGLGRPPSAPGISTAWAGAASGGSVKVDSVTFRGHMVDPPCTPAREGLEIYNATQKRMKYCTGTQWRVSAVDQDEDGLTLELDADDTTPFTPGTAAAAHVLAGRTFYTGAGMTVTSGGISSESAGDLASVDADFVTANIRDDIELFGLTGTYPSAGNPLPGGTADATAAGGQVLTGYEAWTEAGALVDGAMPDRTGFRRSSPRTSWGSEDLRVTSSVGSAPP